MYTSHDFVTSFTINNAQSLQNVIHSLNTFSSSEITPQFTEKFLELLNIHKEYFIPLSDPDDRYDMSSSIQHAIVTFVQNVYPVEKWELFSSYTPLYTKNVEVIENYQHIINLNLNFCDKIYPTFLFSHYFANVIPQLTEIMSSEVVKNFLNIKDFVHVNGLHNPTRFFTFVVNSSEKDFNKELVVEILHQFLKEYDMRDYIPNKIDANQIVRELIESAPNLLQYNQLENTVPNKDVKNKFKKV